ncbi:membrane protein [Devosia limi DSM 17137]|uniref:Membrane protein n=1 Tax=Devosia limi DSM 17137 TaxID=1121477 RepID=A0A0F5LNR4_9HYPH|nr:membrane protein [Devosia limi]KKB83973.1 membrane protein [Devosia limi DSM 17137]SHE45607.1 hypothetical protein SAMN02745223_00428 [Devosia limi DSM 17137]
MPNMLAYLMLCVWPLVTILLFRRLPPGRALIWTILGGYMILPPRAALDLLILPDLDKFAIASLSALFALATAKEGLPKLLPVSMLGRLLLAIFILSPIGTVLTNSDVILFGYGGLPGMQIQELPTMVLERIIVAIPFLLGRALLHDDEALRDILVALVIAGLIYSIPMLIEVRLSPQINVWVYGFFQHDFGQMMRYGGFRPIVFMPHGLWVALFALMTFLAALALARTEAGPMRTRYMFAALYLLVVLYLCKSAGVLVYVVFLAPVVLFMRQRAQIAVSAALACLALLYPALRGAQLVPVDWIVAQAMSFDADRAGSLVYRLNNEALLIGHAAERSLFGWGGWARNHLHDVISGQRLSVIDGRWIEVMSVSGWAGFVGEFGLLALPLLVLARVSFTARTKLSRYAGPLALIYAANLFDLLPNATLVPLTWLLAGAILGHAELGSASRSAATPRHRQSEPAPWAKSRSRADANLRATPKS